MITPDEFRGICHRELLKYRQIEGSRPLSPYAGFLIDRLIVSSEDSTIMFAPPVFSNEFVLSVGESIPDSNFDSSVIIGMEYLIKSNPSTFNQEYSLKTACSRGILIYQKFEKTPQPQKRFRKPKNTVYDINTGECAEVSFDLENEIVTQLRHERLKKAMVLDCVSYNREEVKSPLQGIKGIGLEEGVATLFRTVLK